ncbi:MAG: TlpA family protein disulfide reductase [Sulfuricaulis sp.]|uniref:TlpA disulfide reductase family protein n=1 Tax=Sulfuricaulis sp. TaxID=2003553 RepID=UPI0025D548D8|nr:TlpA disulfide reductase family protein [Sulfuricaulis sp.]MCR4346309.1 TlpA family protein disulfide reductase [Sulfuricaulis sp.]
MKKSTKLLVILIIVAAFAWAGTYLFPLAPPISPETEFVLLDGKKLTLQSLRGRPVLVSFWATTCPPCVEELPDLIQLYKDWHPQGLEMIAVAMPYDPPIRVQEFVQRHNVPYPVALDVQGVVTSAFGGVPFVPTAFIIDPNGKTELNYTGRLDIAKARRIISRYLKAPGA